MVSGWPQGVKNTLQHAFWRQSDQNGPFGGIWHLVFGILRRALRQGENAVLQNFCGNSRGNGVFARGPGAFYFWPVNVFVSLPERGFGMLFCCFHDFSAWVVLFGHFSGRRRRGSGACWKFFENGFKTASGWPWRREKYPTVRILAPWRPKWPT